MEKDKYLNIIKYNKKIQTALNTNKRDYEEYRTIEIEIIPIKNKYVILLMNKVKIIIYILTMVKKKQKEIS